MKRRRFRNYLTLFVLTAVLCTPVSVFARPVSDGNAVSARTSEVSPCADVTEWRYKYINGVLHRRLYNCTKNVWIGDWEPC